MHNIIVCNIHAFFKQIVGTRIMGIQLRIYFTGTFFKESLPFITHYTLRKKKIMMCTLSIYYFDPMKKKKITYYYLLKVIILMQL